MTCCPIPRTLQPVVFDPCINDFRTAEMGESLLVNGVVLPYIELKSDIIIYVDYENGSDFSIDGRIDRPFKTIFGAASFYSRLIPGNFEVRVHFNSGQHIVAARFQVVYPFGSNLVFEGEIETLVSPSIANIDTAASTDSNYPQLRYYEFELDVSGSGAQEGNFVVLEDATSGTNPQVINGLHRIESITSGTAVIRVWQASGTDAVLPSGAITVGNVKLLKSILKFTENSQGIWLNGNASMGQWDNLVIEGSQPAYASSRAGIEMVGGGFIRSGFGLYIHEWGRGLQPFAQGITYLQEGAISKCRDMGVNCTFGGYVSVRESVINGTGSFAISAQTNGQVNATNTKCHSMNNTAVIADNNGFVDISGGSLHYPGTMAGGFGLFARDLSDIDAELATVTGFGTTKSPATNPGNDESRIIGP